MGRDMCALMAGAKRRDGYTSGQGLDSHRAVAAGGGWLSMIASDWRLAGLDDEHARRRPRRHAGRHARRHGRRPRPVTRQLNIRHFPMFEDITAPFSL
jgi:hypothetical protein